MKRILKWASVFAGVVLLFSVTVWLVRRFTPPPRRPLRFEVIAHRGVFQTFPMAGVESDTCTAKRIDPPTHPYIENTIPAMAAAFRDGATMVELDIHPTADNHLVVFHDWILDCRTDGKGVTHQHTLAELKKLDVGYGYTADGGRSYPLRGTGVGMMPSLEEVFAAIPDKPLLIHQKDNYERTVELLGALVNSLPPEQRKLIFFYGNSRTYPRLHQIAPDIQRFFPTGDEMKRCGKSLLMRLGFGDLPQACYLPSIVLPVKDLWLVPGWPNSFLRKTAAAHVPVYVIDVDTPEEAQTLVDLPVNGIMTNKIEVVGRAGFVH